MARLPVPPAGRPGPSRDRATHTAFTLAQQDPAATHWLQTLPPADQAALAPEP